MPTRAAPSSCDIREALHEEVCRAHPHLQRVERMVDRLAALGHGLRVHLLMLPALDAPLSAGRAAMLDRAVATRIRPIAKQLLPVLLVRVVVFQLLAGRTAIASSSLR
jgi:hypothetical protein